MAAARHANGAPLHQQILRLPGVTRGQAPPGLIECSFRRPIGGNVPHWRAAELFQPKIGTGIELHDLHVLLDERDERQEQRTIEAVLVKLARRYVRCRDHHHTELEQVLEQSPKNHGVGDVGDVELVEAKQPRLLCDRRGGEGDRILAADFA